jgi:hypothetical protein
MRLRVLRVLRVVENALILAPVLHAARDVQHARHVIGAQHARPPHDARTVRQRHVHERDVPRTIAPGPVPRAVARGAEGVLVRGAGLASGLEQQQQRQQQTESPSAHMGCSITI